MQLSDVRFGISRLPDGTPVMTPHSWAGEAYEFSQPVYDRLRFWLKITIAAGLTSFAAGGWYFYVANEFDSRHVGELFWLTLALWDYLRILVIRLVFSGARDLGMIPAMRDPAADLLFPAALALRLLFNLLGPLAVFDLATDLLSGASGYARIVSLLIFVRAGAYICVARYRIEHR